MKAKAGDRLIVEGHSDTEHRREAEVVEVHGEDGAPPYLVRWKDGREGLFFPGTDTRILPGG